MRMAAAAAWPTRAPWAAAGELAEGVAPCAEPKRRRRNALATTDALENAIGAPAMTGLSTPAAASGSAASL
jgi:hypothetical protein